MNEKKLSDDELPLPSLKHIAAESDIQYSKIKSLLKAIYEDVCKLNFDAPEKFVTEGQKLCYCSFEFLNCYATFNLGLNVIPKIGECLYFHFIKPLNGGNQFYVKYLIYDIKNDRQDILISLTHQLPNLYMELLKEKAYLKGYISLMDCLSSNNLSLEEKLTKMIPNL